VVLALNKIDRVPKPRILTALDAWSKVGRFADIVPISAKDGDNVDRLEQVLLSRLPEGRPLYPDDFLTDLPERFFVAEMVRERILRRGGSMLKKVGSEARQQIEAFLGTKVYLGLFVKVRERWRENEALLDQMGLGESGGRLGTGGEP
jgi:GTP-binding protein Era